MHNSYYFVFVETRNLFAAQIYGVNNSSLFKSKLNIHVCYFERM